MDEQVAGPVRERLYRGEIDRFPEVVRRTFSTLLHLQPEMMEWLDSGTTSNGARRGS